MDAYTANNGYLTTETDPSVNAAAKANLSTCAAGDVLLLGSLGWECSTNVSGTGKWADGSDSGDIYYTGGNVGIGTDEPGAKLEILDNDPTIILKNNSSNQASSGAIIFDESSGDKHFQMQYDGLYDQLNFVGLQNTEDYVDLMSIERGGNVGIGTTSPNAHLEIDSKGGAPSETFSTTASNASLSLASSDGITGIGTGTRLLGGIGGSEYAWFQAQNSISETGNNAKDISLNPIGGNVGIGTSSPSEVLEIQAAEYSGPHNIGFRSNGNWGSRIGYTDVSDGSGQHYFHIDGKHAGTWDNNQFVVRSDSGNVGIATLSPDAKLDVEGSLQADTFTGEASIYTHAQDITTSGAVDVEYYLAERSNGIDYPSAAFVNETNGTVDIHYLDYSGAGLTIGEFQPETTLTGFTSPNDAESFEYNDITYLVVGDDSTEVKAYAWDAANHEFTLLSGDEIEVAGHVDTEVFIQENRQIVAIAQSSGITLYEWGGSNFNPIQTIGLADARKLYFFEADLNADDATEGYLAAAAGDGLVIYQWQNGKNFEPMTLAHTLDATHSQNAHYFEIDSRQFLMVSRNQDTAGSPLYEWTGTEFELAQTIDTYSGSLGATYFQINGTHYLVVIARGSGVHNDYLLFYWYEDGAFQYRENIVYANTSGDLADIEYSFLDGADERSRIIMAEGTTSRALLLDQYNNTSVEDNLFVGGQDIIMAANNTQKNIDGISYEDNNDAFPGNRGVFSFHADQEHRPGWDSPGAAISASGGYFAGDVGIGTTEPEAKLHINGDDNDGTNAALKISSGSQVMLIDGNEIDSYDNEVPINIHINGNAGADTIFNKNGGNVGIGTSSSIGTTCADDARLCVNGNIYAQTTKLNSDSRLKTSVTTIPSALEKILSLRGVTFEWKQEEFPDRNFADGTQIGLIAQEVEEVFPELVSQGEYKSVSYANLVSPLIEAVKELHALYQGHADRLAALEAQNAELETQNAHQDERIAHQDELIVQLEVRLAALEAAQ